MRGPVLPPQLNFRWIKEAALAGCRSPRSLDELRLLREAGVGAIVRLAFEEEVGITLRDVTEAGLEDLYEPIEELGVPSLAQIDGVIKFIKASLDRRRSVAVSCGFGYGRTGTMLACFLVNEGVEPDEAIERAGTVETKPQREIVHGYAARLRAVRRR